VKTLGLLSVVVILLVFTISCISKEVPVTETYSETEYRTETYTTTEYIATNTEETMVGRMGSRRMDSRKLFN
jgi:hypothetical protein